MERREWASAQESREEGVEGECSRYTGAPSVLGMGRLAKRRSLVVRSRTRATAPPIPRL